MTEGQKALLIHIENALRNLDSPMTDAQRDAIADAVQVTYLYQIDFNEAVDQCIKLEKAGFIVEAKWLQAVMEAIL